jgi:thioredoxin-related protein/outer membrane protein OmpA-like peptidoglycan-associated protein
MKLTKVLLTLHLLIIYALGFSQMVDFKNLSLTEAKALSIKLNKPLYVDFYTTWCGPCKQMERDVFTDDDVANFMNERYISVRIDAEKQDLDQVQTLNIRAYPTSIYYSSTGKVLFREEGYLNAEEFLSRVQSLFYFNQYEKEYDRKPNNSEAAYNYFSALEITNKTRAKALAKKFITNADVKNYIEGNTWKIIQKFITATDKFLFVKVLNHDELPIHYPQEFKVYLLSSIDEQVAYSIEKNKVSLLNESLDYLKQYPNYFTNADSLNLLFKLRFAFVHQTLELVPTLRTYTNKYIPNQQEIRLGLATELIEKHFKKEVLTFAEELAEATIREKPSAKAYYIKAMANDKMNNFTAALGNVMLAYNYADEEISKQQLDEYSKDLNNKLTIEFNGGVNTSRVGGSNKDGRFTLGAGTKRLMYGYPIPESTSHFIVNINGKLASNANHFALPVTQLKGKLKYEGEGATPKVTDEYTFEKVIIRQILSPVDKNGNEIKEGLAQYYKISYQFQNTQNLVHKIGLAILFDTMVDDNDNCNIMAGKRPLNREIMFIGELVPPALQFYRTPRDTSDVVGEAILKGNHVTSPDRVIIGRWPVLHHQTWKLSAVQVPYGDSAYMLQWENRNLSQNETIEISTMYGLPKFKKPELQAVMKGEVFLTKYVSIYFETGSDRLDLNAQMTIAGLAEDKEIKIRGVLLNGYADITGDGEFNFDLSKRRIAAVSAIFEASKIATMPKPHGIDQAQRNEFDKIYGNSWDRRVDIIVYYQLYQKLGL